MADPLARFHETWLGLAQPYEGLVVSIPVLVDAQIGPSSEAAAYEAFRELATAGGTARIGTGAGKTHPPSPSSQGSRRVVRDLPRFYSQVLGFREDSFAPPAESHALYVAEGPETLRPSWVLPSREFGLAEGARPEALGMEVSPEVSLDKPDVSAAWAYPPTAKLERLLRHTRVPIGLLSNGRELRLIYAPEGESAGHLTFRFDDLAKADGKPLFDAMRALVSYRSFYGARAGASLRELCEASRTRQLDVTQALAKQVLDALEVLVSGFGKAEERDKLGALAAAREDGTLTRGLLTLLLRLVFLLYAEDRGLLPTEHPLFATTYSLFGLFARLTADRQAFPDTMPLRFGAYGELVSLFRAVFFGVNVRTSGGDEAHEAHGLPLFMPERKGELFDPQRFPFLEGWLTGAAPAADEEARSEVRVPTVDDGTLLAVLERLIVFEGQRLSYATLDVEQIGSVYEGLMGFDVKLADSPCVRIGPSRAWVSAYELWNVPARERGKFLQEETGLAKAQAQKIADAFSETKDELAGMAVLEGYRVKGTELAGVGTLLLQPGPERWRTSSHYTPRSLSAPIVRRTLEPLLKVLGPEPTAAQILSLKVCDPAMGSGAFLVEACRVLGSEVEAAWRRDAVSRRLDTDVQAPGHELPTGAKQGECEGERLTSNATATPTTPPDLTLEARRRVAETCLYGVDKNPDAVILAKLSLWLVTLAKDKPFSFLDHCLKSGDSLVGLSLAQIEAFTYSPVDDPSKTEQKGSPKAKPEKRKKGDPLPGQLTLFTGLIEGELREAISLRHRLEKLSEQATPAAAAEKAWLVQDADDALCRVKRIADAIVGAFFAHTKDKDRKDELQKRKDHVEAWLGRRDIAPTEELLEWQRALHEKVNVFHWPLEFPEVFWPGRPDPLDGGRTEEPACFDAFVGNPPFLGGSVISQQFGDTYKEWLFILHDGTQGKTDLAAHFFRRAAAHLGHHGAVGFVATNTIAQGDTRESGLGWLCARGLLIFSAIGSLPWPGQAAVTVSTVCGALGTAIRACPPPTLDGKCVGYIDSRLRADEVKPDPSPLFVNGGLSFKGCEIAGQGFLVDQGTGAALANSVPVVKMYVGGEDVNSRPSQDSPRYVIDFDRMELEEASLWREFFAQVKDRVKPDRELANRDGRRRYWWRFGEVQPAMRAAIAPLRRCLVTARVTKHLCFSFQPTDRILNEKLYVFPIESYTFFGVMQSRVHHPWVWLLSSTMKTDLNYSASDCFATFPFPHPDPRTVNPAVEAAGEAFYTRRAEYMLRENVGLTVTYNRLKDPVQGAADLLELRDLTCAMDRAVLEAYGWSDLVEKVPPYCAATEEDKAAQKAFGELVVDRLYALNATRAKEEAALAARAAGGGAKKAAGKAKAKAQKAEE
jgi:hypothetical protein